MTSRTLTRDSTAAVLAAGCRRVGYVGPADAAGAARLAGFLDAHAERGLGVDDTLVVLGPRTARAAQAACDALLSTADPPHAIVVDEAAHDDVGILDAVRPAMVAGTTVLARSAPG